MSGLRRTALTTEKIAVLTPMPSASAEMAAKVKAGLLANIRSDCLKSWKRVPIGWLRDDAIEFDTRVYVALGA